MNALSLILLVALFAAFGEARVVKRERRQAQGSLPPVATGEILTSAFQIPIQTLNAVHDLLQATRGRWNALQERYQIQQQQHPNHRLNPHFVLPERKASQKDRRRHDRTQQNYGDQYDRRLYNSKALYQ